MRVEVHHLPDRGEQIRIASWQANKALQPREIERELVAVIAEPARTGDNDAEPHDTDDRDGRLAGREPLADVPTARPSRPDGCSGDRDRSPGVRQCPSYLHSRTPESGRESRLRTGLGAHDPTVGAASDEETHRGPSAVDEHVARLTAGQPRCTAKQLIGDLIDHGVDVTDQEQLAAGVAAHNDEIDRRTRKE